METGSVLRFEFCSRPVARGTEVLVYFIEHKGILVTSTHRALFERLQGIFHLQSEDKVLLDATAAILAGAPLPSGFNLKGVFEGVVLGSTTCIRLISESRSTTFDIIVRVEQKRLQLEGEETGQERILQTQHPRFFLGEGSLEARWPDGRVQLIDWSQRFDVRIHRAPGKGAAPGQVDIHLQISQRRPGGLEVVSLTLPVVASEAMDKLPELVAYHPRLGPEDAARLIAVVQRRAALHGVQI